VTFILKLKIESQTMINKELSPTTYIKKFFHTIDWSHTPRY